jgi:hypothetical protein
MPKDQRLPDSLLPELRGKWIKLVGARETVQAAAQAMQRIEGDYQQTLNVCLRVLGLDPATNWRVNLETGEISEVTAADVVRSGNGTPGAQGAEPGAVPWVAPTPPEH